MREGAVVDEKEQGQADRDTQPQLNPWVWHGNVLATQYNTNSNPGCGMDDELAAFRYSTD
jgi:hypothetical protein